MSYSEFYSLDLSPSRAVALVAAHFNLTAVAEKLPGDADFNFKMTAADGKKYTLKVSRPAVSRSEIELQIALMLHLQNQNLALALPQPVPAANEKYITEITDAEGCIRLLRLQKYVEGRVLGEVKPRTPDLLRQWGRTCGSLSRALRDFTHSAAHRSYKWNPSETLLSRPHAVYFDEQQRKIAAYFWDLFERETLPRLSDLRRSVNHNDLHEYNVLVSSARINPQTVGVIDFGDALYTHTVNEAAIAGAYAGMDLPDPLAAIAELVGGYHAEFPLEEKEVAVLFSLITARLLITVANAAYSRRAEPENAYLQSSEVQAWAVLEKLYAVPPAFAHYTLRRACGWEPCPQYALFAKWREKHRADFAEPVRLKARRVMPFDLSTGSLALGNNENFLNIKAFEKTVNRMLEDAGAYAGIGGYGEVRPVYTTDAYREIGNSGVRWRTVHLGTDIWTEAGTPVYALWAGKVHSLQDNDAERDYGPTIILEHQVSDKLTFYTLYGHLNRAALDGLKPGDPIRKGQKIAEIGPAPENGNWPPHLHFQVMLDMLGKSGDFPGVAFLEESATWLSVCPDIFREKHSLPDDRIRFEHRSILAARHQYLGKNLSISYQNPLHIVRGYKQYLYDSGARRYLDTCNNVPHVGHQHPQVVRTLCEQGAVLNTNTRYLHENVVLYAEELAALFPPELCAVFLVNSGSEANELALRMARYCTEQKDMLVTEVGYHGNTGGTMAVSSYKFAGKGGAGAPAHTHVLPLPDIYRGAYRGADAGSKYAAFAEAAIGKIQGTGRNIAGCISESILSCGGQIVPPAGYLAEVYRRVRAAGGLCIADEVQTGLGRVGSHWWSFELQGVVPDIVTLGKPIGNGHPLAAVVTTRAIADKFAEGPEYFNTFGGNPVSCAVGRAVLQVLREEGLRENALQTGNYLLSGLRNLQQRHPIVGDVRGHGFFSGFELVRNPDTLEPAAVEAAHLANRLRARAILLSTDGPLHNVLKIKPPMCFSRTDADFLLSELDMVLGEDAFKM